VPKTQRTARLRCSSQTARAWWYPAQRGNGAGGAVAGNPAGSAQRALVCMINTGQPGLMLDDRQARRRSQCPWGSRSAPPPARPVSCN